MNPNVDYHPPDEAFNQYITAHPEQFRDGNRFFIADNGYPNKAGQCQRCGAARILYLHARKRVWRCGDCLKPADRVTAAAW